MSDLNDWISTLERTVAPPGTYATYYPSSTDDDLAGYLMDAFCESQLEGFFTTGFSIDLDSGIVTPDLPDSGLRLITIYAAITIMRGQILNTKTKQLYKAGTAESDVEYSPNVLVKALASLEAAKAVIVQRLLQSGAAYAIHMVDQYFVRDVQPAGDYWAYYDANIDRAYDYNAPWAG